MSERLQDQETVDPDEFDVDLDESSLDLDGADVDSESTGDGASVVNGASDTSSGGRLSRFVPSLGIRRRLPGFSAKRFGLATVACAVGVFVGGFVPLVGGITQYAGLLAAAFLLGLTGRVRYLEAAPAGAVAAGVSVLLGTLSAGTFVLGVDLVRRYGLAITGVGVTAGLLLAVIGLYFGRDLRNGLTRSV